MIFYKGILQRNNQNHELHGRKVAHECEEPIQRGSDKHRERDRHSVTWHCVSHMSHRNKCLSVPTVGPYTDILKHYDVLEAG